MHVQWIILLCVAALVRTCTGSAWLQDPPSRSAAWYYQVQTPVNYNFRNLNCGNKPVKINLDGSRNCGLCGDDYMDPIPRPNEWGGTYASPRVRTRYYESGQVAELSLWNNLPGAPGFYEFRLCDEEDNQSQNCLNKHLLTILETNTTNMPVPDTQGLVVVHVQLPVGVTCDYCLLQWRFRKESIEGCDHNNWCGLGRGAQIEYYNCADVMIGAVGEPKPNFIQDPTYNAADYGSAYDIEATGTDAPNGTNIVGTTTTTDSPTTTTTDNGIIIITNPPRTTTQQPTTTTTDQLRTTTTDSGTTTTDSTNIITIPTAKPTTTTSSGGQTPDSERLIVNADGSSAGTLVSGDDGGGSVNRQLLVLLSFLPLLGAYGLQHINSAGYIPPIAPAQMSSTVPMFPIYFGNSLGFGNFAAGNYGALGGSYGKSYNTKTSGTYGSRSHQTNLAFGTGTQFVNRSPVNAYQNTNMLNNGVANGLNTGGTNFVQNPVVWTNTGVNINNGLTRFRRAVKFQSQASYQHTPGDYSNTGVGIQPPLPLNTYQSKPSSTGYSPHNNLLPTNSRMNMFPPSNEYQPSQSNEYGSQNSQWPVLPVPPRPSIPQNNPPLPRLQGIQIPNQVRPNNGIGRNQWPTNNGGNNGGNNLGNGNNNGNGNTGSTILNAISQGQRLPPPETATQRTLNVNPQTTKIDDPFNLPGIESEARFQNNEPPQRFSEPEPGQRSPGRNVALVKTSGLNALGTGLRNMNPSSQFMRSEQPMQVNDWYRLLFGRLPSSSRVI